MLKRYSHTQSEAKKAAIQKLSEHLDLSVADTYLDTKDGTDPSVSDAIVAITPSEHSVK